MKRSAAGGGAFDQEAESATNNQAEPSIADDNNGAAVGHAMPLAATIAVMAATAYAAHNSVASAGPAEPEYSAGTGTALT